MPERYLDADPYPWPFDGDLRPTNTALIIIDMQTDFCGPGGYVDTMGYDLSLTRAPIEPIRAVLAAFRAGGLHVFHTREGQGLVPGERLDLLRTGFIEGQPRSRPMPPRVCLQYEFL